MLRLHVIRRNCKLSRVTAPTLFPGPTIPMGPPSASPTCHVAPPLSYQGPLYPWALHLPALHVTWCPTCAHVDSRGCVAPYHVAAPCAPLAPCVGHPLLCHVASAPHGTRAVVPRASCQLAGAPARHVSTCR